MATLGISNTDLECDGDKEGSVCFSDAVEGGSCNSQFYDDCSFACGSEILEDGDLEYLDLESGEKAAQEVIERDCRICHLGLVSSSPSSGIAIQLGCSCKDDLAAAHRHCAETWFKIKGNKTCEICNSVACNVVGPTDIEAVQQVSESHADGAATATSLAPTPFTLETRTCLNGHRFLNFLLACMVFAFVISWLFHFNIPS
ncbi:uncharacterized protein LOC121793753 [Salvia splendens]|uniref:uncharacterized protein LOC121793753 n=1 Tax=Salvia splendens TaxID=180675 RepID=UPI001C254A13|nr:uncharacterized protein LOC121793753 [Salvia splendens]